MGLSYLTEDQIDKKIGTGDPEAKSSPQLVPTVPRPRQKKTTKSSVNDIAGLENTEEVHASNDLQHETKITNASDGTQTSTEELASGNKMRRRQSVSTARTEEEFKSNLQLVQDRLGTLSALDIRALCEAVLPVDTNWFGLPHIKVRCTAYPICSSLYDRSNLHGHPQALP